MVAISTAVVKPIVDALLKAFAMAKKHRLKKDANAALTEAIRDLLKIDPNESLAEARIATAKAAGIISEDLFFAEKLLAASKKVAKKPAAKKAARKPAAKKKAAKKPAAKKAAKKPAAKK